MAEITADTQFVTETLYTDTRTYEIIGRTPKTLKIRTMQDGAKVKRVDDGSGYPQVWTTQESDEDGRVYVVRLNKRGEYHVNASRNRLRPATMIDGKPVRYQDYRF